MSSTPRRLFRLCRTLIAASAAMLLSVGMASAGSWSATDVHGTVLSLTGDKWEDVASGQAFPGNLVVRTLGTGRVTLAGGGVGLKLGGNAAVQIVEQGRSYALKQFAGALAVAADAAHMVTVEVPNGRVSFNAGQIMVSISGAITRIEVRQGSARVVDAQGVDSVLLVGQSARVADAGISIRDEQGRPVEVEQPGQGVAGTNPNAGTGNNPNAGAGNNNAGGTGNGNNSAGDGSPSGNANAGAGNNNAGGNGNGNGNDGSAAGDGSSSAGAGNGNGNAGGNGNGNGGGSENAGAGNNNAGGNGGGNGNGNGGGNGNGNGNGN